MSPAAKKPREKSLLESVPLVLRGPINDYSSVLPVVLSQRLADVPMEVAISYIDGAILHQYRISREESKHFKGKITEIEEIERHGSSGFLLGKKARIYFEGQSLKKSSKGRDQNNDNVEEQHIDTGWIEYHGYNPEQFAWEIALSNAIVDFAEEHIGDEVVFQKAFVEGVETQGGGDRIRYVADIKFYGKSDDDDDDTDDSDDDDYVDTDDADGDDGADDDDDADGDVTIEDIEAAADALEVDLQDGDADFLCGLVGLAQSDIVDEFKGYIDGLKANKARSEVKAAFVEHDDEVDAIVSAFGRLVG